jgi:hypothetical protein
MPGTMHQFHWVVRRRFIKIETVRMTSLSEVEFIVAESPDPLTI